jgi:ubiquinone biosynthesis protein UbiJ
MATDPFLQPIESLLNRNIDGAARARELALRLAGRSLEVRVTPTPVRIRFSVAEGRVSVAAAGEGEPDAVIEGTPLSLASLAGPEPEDRIRQGAIRISGDAETAQLFQKLFKAARPDFEEELSRVVGDVAAHHLANTARGVLDFGRRAADTFARNMGEYLTEESRDLPAQPEVEAWIEQVDRLREDADRLEARLALLSRSRRGGGA